MALTSPASQRALVAMISPAVAATGHDLEHLSVTRAGRRHVLRVVVDGDGGVSLDGVAAVAKAVSLALDAADDGFGEPYTLEVSSPGVDRPLTEHRHWRRNVGRLVTVRVRADGASGRDVTGRVVAVEGDLVVLEVDGVRTAVPHADLGPGRIQVEFARRTAAGVDGADGADGLHEELDDADEDSGEELDDEHDDVRGGRS